MDNFLKKIYSIHTYDMFIKSDLLSKFIILSLVLMSMYSWYVFFERKFFFINIKKGNENFEKKFWSGIMLEEFYATTKGKIKVPYGKIFNAAMEEWTLSGTNEAINAIELVKTGLRERIKDAVTIVQNKNNNDINKNITVLSVIATISPLIGLFGTVWGIMNSFKAIGESNSVSIVSIAPGIAEALLTTAAGLIVAIPSTIFYSITSKNAEIIMSSVENFSFDCFNVMSRELDNFSVKNYNAYQKRNT